MFNTRRVTLMLLSLLASGMVYAADTDFPVAPVNLKEAEAKGLHRLSADELKAFFPGTMELKRHRGGKATKTFKPDGSVEVVAVAEKHSGTWRLDEKRGVYCDSFQRKKDTGERCYAVYSAGDGIHHFDYDIADKLQTITWRRAADK